MKRASLRVCLAQINTTVGDLGGNAQKARQALEEARRRKAQLVVFPELTLTGYPPEDLLFQENFVSENLKALKSVLPATRGLVVVLGFVEKRGQSLYNAAAVLAEGKVQKVYHKAELPNYGVFDEKRYFTPGKEPVIADIGGLRLGISICEDMWQKDSFVYRPEYRGVVSALINISASPYHAGKQVQRLSLLKGLSRRIQAPVIYLNLVGGQDELVFDGGSAVVEGSRLLAEARHFEEECRIADISVKLFESKVPAEIPPVFLKLRRSWKKAGKAPKKLKREVLGPEAEIYKALMLGTRDYVRKNGFQKVLIGLSGGIDSALVAVIAVDALGAENVIGVTMPSPYTSLETLSDAKELAVNLKIKCLEFRIDEILKDYLEIMSRALQEPVEGTAEENLQARIRGNMMMALSNKYGHLVLTTGNKSEMATGYCTLYGDMAGGFAVIKDVPKTLVFRLARYRNRLGGVIPESTLRRPPTAELRFNQTDQDTLPPYELLDRFLGHYIENDASLASAIRKGIPTAAARKMKRLVDRNEYKRRQAPPGIKITPKAFGRDRRMPITNRFPG